MSSGNSYQAQIHGLMGATGCGKSTEFKKRLAEKPRPRTLIWSPKEKHDNYAAYFKGSVVVRRPVEVGRILLNAGARDFHIVFKPTDDMDEAQDKRDFCKVCKMILAAGNCTMAVDELHTVTSPSRAETGWKLLNSMGRASMIDVFGMSTRPAQVDKQFLGNLSSLYVGRLSYYEDQQAMARSLNVPVDQVAQLYNYDHLKRDFITGKLDIYKTGEEKPTPKPKK